MPSNIVAVSHGPVTLLVRIVNYAAGILELILGVRFFLGFIGANAGSGFAAFINKLSDILLVPFRGILPPTVIQGSLFEWSTLFAMAAYAVAGYLLIQLVLLLVPETDLIETEQVDMDTLSNV